jgi:hypothetical protein
MRQPTKHNLILALIAVLVFAMTYFWPASRASNDDPRSDEYSHGECP